MDSVFQYTDDDIKAISTIKQYPKAIHFGDPDVKKRSFVALTSTTLELQKASIYVQSISKNDFETRRNKTKVFLQRGIEINENSRTEYFLEAVKSYRYPQRDETSQSTSPILKPIHDWCSHPSTAMEYFFVNIESFSGSEEVRPSWADKIRGAFSSVSNSSRTSSRSSRLSSRR